MNGDDDDNDGGDEKHDENADDSSRKKTARPCENERGKTWETMGDASVTERVQSHEREKKCSPSLGVSLRLGVHG